MKVNLNWDRGTEKTGKNRLFSTFVVGTAMGFLAFQSQGQVYTLSDQNSTAQVNTTNQSGMFNWVVDGQNVLNQQWFWIGVSNSAPISIDKIGSTSSSMPTSQLLDTTNANANYSVQVDYLLTGAPNGSGQSDIGESIRIANTSATTQTFHFYEYSQFNLAGGPNSIQLGKNLKGYFDLADQENGLGTSLSETVATPGAQEGEAEPFNVTLAKLNNGVLPVTLSGNMAAGPGNVTWAFEWDITLAAGTDFLISKDKSVDVAPIPEPASLSLISLGLIALAARKFRASK
jgi:hypothetical protein